MRKLLVVVDMQKDFIDGALGTKEAVGIVPAVVSRIGEYAAEDVFVTRDTHQKDYLSTQEGKKLPVEHCIEGTPGWELDARVAAAVEGATVVNKPTFGSTELVDMIKRISEKEDVSIELIGLCTDICVVSNALLLKAAMPEAEISVDASCCAGVTPEKHKAALETMSSCQITIKGI
ncbi:MAG: cysteine hydrolase [Lachnospiraceae bacterium]|nr:cysteine hydrolase [Lachnospiraceae bacterium]